MGVYAGIISSVIGTGIKLLGSSQSPNYPSAPKIAKLPVQQAKTQMEDYEARRMQSSIDAWKTRFPLLYKGGQYEVSDIANNQKGMLSDAQKTSLSNAGLDAPKEGNQYSMSSDLGLSPLTLAQRNSQAVTRQIALNPEWTNKISGGTLATMVANNYQNQNAFSQFLGAQNTAKYVAGQTQSMYNTAALTAGLVGTAAIGAQVANNYGPTSALGQGVYSGTPTTPPGYTGGPASSFFGGNQTPSYSQPYQAPTNPYGNSYDNWMQPIPTNYVTAPPPY